MTSPCLPCVLPTPKRIARCPGGWSSAAAARLTLAVHSVGVESLAAWLGQELRRAPLGLALDLVPPTSAAIDIRLGRVADLVTAGQVPAEWAQAAPFTGACGREQGYVLEIRPAGVVLAAAALPGLQNAVATLLQMLAERRPGAPLPCVHIEDWPDVRFRVATDWLLNAEINRWGLERGDGQAATAARLRRQLDQAARLKSNVVWFDGFGWDADRTPGYAALVRALAAYARERHIRLAHAGYGGGYGFAYQKHFIYDSPYYGRIFENRTHYPDGPTYDCVGHPRYAASWRYGTCLANAPLATLKLAELTDFVRRCQPGMLYLHDIDTGDFDLAWEGWKRRCPACRERWPDDAMVSPHGAAAAYAHWYRQVATAVAAVTAADGNYVAARDCTLVCVGPVYTAAHDADEVWLEECRYFGLVSALMGPVPNVQFGLREQVVPTATGGSRVALLQEHLQRAGNGHGAFVVAFVGGDNYFSDTLVPAGAALAASYAGADTVYTKNLGAVADPAQALCAEYAWNAAAPGMLAVPHERGAALDLLSRCQKGRVVPPGWRDADGTLARACRLLYGPRAAPAMAQLVALGLEDGLAPVATGWGAVSREVATLLATGAPPADASARGERWGQRARVTTQALALLTQVLADDGADPVTRADWLWLQTRLRVGQLFCRVLVTAWQWRLEPQGDGTTALGAALDEVDQFLHQAVPQDTVDPVGGDITVWYAMAAKLRAALP